MSNSTATSNPAPAFAIVKARTRFFGLTLDECIQAYFGGNAFVAVLVLALITLFLFREGYQFFGENHKNITVYRQAGLEYVDVMRRQESDHTALTRYLSDLRLRTLTYLTKDRNLPQAAANAQLAAFDDFSEKYSDTRSQYGELARVARCKTPGFITIKSPCSMANAFPESSTQRFPCKT